MTTLEKILHEIENLKKLYSEIGLSLMDKGNLPCGYDRSDIESAKVKAISEVMEIIKKHISCENHAETTRQSQDNGWIPVEDGVPEEGQEVWITINTDAVKRGMYTKHFSGEYKEGFICSGGFVCISLAKYWMPYIIPEPYKPPVESAEEKSMREREEFFKDGE